MNNDVAADSASMSRYSGVEGAGGASQAATAMLGAAAAVNAAAHQSMSSNHVVE